VFARAQRVAQVYRLRIPSAPETGAQGVDQQSQAVFDIVADAVRVAG